MFTLSGMTKEVLFIRPGAKRYHPNPVLRATARTVENIDGRLLKLADYMLNVMYSAPGIGLAANQVGELERLIVFDRQPGKEGRDPCVLINPEIVLSEGETKYEEVKEKEKTPEHKEGLSKNIELSIFQ